jgi:colicin import membrane protein
MQQLLSSLEDERQRQFRRFVGVSAAVHAALALLMWIGPIRSSRPSLPVVERVELVEALAPAARPAPTRPAPAPAKPKPPPPPAKKILPKEPAPLPKPKPVEAKPKPEPKPEPRVEPEPEPKPQEEPAPEQDYEDVLADLRKEVGETAPKPVEQAAAPSGGPVGGPGILDPELARWHREVKILVTRAWIVPAGFRSEALVAHVEVDLSPTGDVLGTRVAKTSGNPWFDESVERAIEKASPLPAPPEPGEWTILFDSRDMH